MFQIGAKVVYPGHGVGVIEDIQERQIQGVKRKFFILRLSENRMTIMIPTEHVAATGLRPVIGKDTATEVYRILRAKKSTNNLTNWARRHQDYGERIRTGSIIEIAKIFRDLLILKSEKELSFSERTVLDTARTLLVEELAIATQNPEEKILMELHTMYIKNVARLVPATRS